MFSRETEFEISINIGPSTYGGLITLSSKAYLEILQAARAYDGIRNGCSHHFLQNTNNQATSLNLGSTSISMVEDGKGCIDFTPQN